MHKIERQSKSLDSVVILMIAISMMMKCSKLKKESKEEESLEQKKGENLKNQKVKLQIKFLERDQDPMMMRKWKIQTTWLLELKEMYVDH